MLGSWRDSHKFERKQGVVYGTIGVDKKNKLHNYNLKHKRNN